MIKDALNAYTFDANGNRTMPGYSTGPNNQITSDGTYNYYADKNGNIVQRTKIATGEVFTYSLDNRNRMTGAIRTTSAGVQMQAGYAYDALGQRVQAAVTIAGTTTTTRFAYDETRQIWADTDGSNALTMRYILGNQVLERLARISAGGTISWLLQDRLGSIRNVVDNTGALIDTLAFDGFGNLVSESNLGNGGLYLFAGYRLDPETGFYRPDPTAGRIYNPFTGTWQSVDPISFDGGDANLRRYVGNNPGNLVDLFGLQSDAPSLSLPEIRKLKPNWEDESGELIWHSQEVIFTLTKDNRDWDSAEVVNSWLWKLANRFEGFNCPENIASVRVIMDPNSNRRWAAFSSKGRIGWSQRRISGDGPNNDVYVELFLTHKPVMVEGIQVSTNRELIAMTLGNHMLVAVRKWRLENRLNRIAFITETYERRNSLVADLGMGLFGTSDTIKVWDVYLRGLAKKGEESICPNPFEQVTIGKPVLRVVPLYIPPTPFTRDPLRRFVHEQLINGTPVTNPWKREIEQLMRGK